MSTSHKKLKIALNSELINKNEAGMASLFVNDFRNVEVTLDEFTEAVTQRVWAYRLDATALAAVQGIAAHRERMKGWGFLVDRYGPHMDPSETEELSEAEREIERAAELARGQPGTSQDEEKMNSMKSTPLSPPRGVEDQGPGGEVRTLPHRDTAAGGTIPPFAAVRPGAPRLEAGEGAGGGPHSDRDTAVASVPRRPHAGRPPASR